MKQNRTTHNAKLMCKNVIVSTDRNRHYKSPIEIEIKVTFRTAILEEIRNLLCLSFIVQQLLPPPSSLWADYISSEYVASSLASQIIFPITFRMSFTTLFLNPTIVQLSTAFRYDCN
jgi:formate-dependent nitrite reductase membrane component NrfD